MEGGAEGALIKLEKHAGLNTLLMSTTKEAGGVSGVCEVCLCMLVFKYVRARACELNSQR